MAQTLKDFTKEHLSAETEDGYKPRWRRVVPAQLQVHNKYADRGWFRNPYREALEEKWERIHKGVVIDIEWREVDYVNDDFDY